MLGNLKSSSSCSLTVFKSDCNYLPELETLVILYSLSLIPQSVGPSARSLYRCLRASSSLAWLFQQPPSWSPCLIASHLIHLLDSRSESVIVSLLYSKISVASASYRAWTPRLVKLSSLLSLHVQPHLWTLFFFLRQALLLLCSATDFP